YDRDGKLLINAAGSLTLGGLNLTTAQINTMLDNAGLRTGATVTSVSTSSPEVYVGIGNSGFTFINSTIFDPHKVFNQAPLSNTGVQFNNAVDGAVINSDISSMSTAVSITGGSNIRVLDSSLHGNAGGVGVGGGSGHLVDGNHIFNNTNVGISGSGGTGIVFSDNLIENSGTNGNGIGISESNSGVTISGNTISGQNGGTSARGILVTGGGAVVTGN